MLVKLVLVAFRDPGNQSPWSLCWPGGLWVEQTELSVWLPCLFQPMVVFGLDGKAIAMMFSASLCAASAILSASTGLVIN